MYGARDALLSGAGLSPQEHADEWIARDARQVALQAVRADGTAVELPEIMVRPGGYRFLPDGTGIVYIPRIQGLDFWQFDLATRTSRQLTTLGNQGAIRTFDITRDQKYIVFDRSRQNSNIVLFDLSK